MARELDPDSLIGVVDGEFLHDRGATIEINISDSGEHIYFERSDSQKMYFSKEAAIDLIGEIKCCLEEMEEL